MSLHLLYEILMALAAVATVAEFILEAVREYKHRRMERKEKKKTGGNRS